MAARPAAPSLPIPDRITPTAFAPAAFATVLSNRSADGRIPLTGSRAIRRIDPFGQRSIKDLGGPLAIAKASGEQASLGIAPFVLFVAMISLNLGFVNLLPLPMLDGGHLLFNAIEAVRRRPVSIATQQWAFRAGFFALASLMLIVTFNDLSGFGLWQKLAGLIG